MSATAARRLYTPQSLFRRDPKDLQRLIDMATHDFNHETTVYHGMDRTETKLTAAVTITDACAMAYAHRVTLAQLNETIARISPDMYGLTEVLEFARVRKLAAAGADHASTPR